MPRRYLVISDLHLCDVEDNPDGWKEYKHSRYRMDERLADVLAGFCRDGAADDQRVLVLNGDVVDYDLVTAIPEDPPWPVSRRERRVGLHCNEAKSVWKLERILDDHSVFVSALARFLAEGHRVVYVSGNHDTENFFPGIKELWRRRLQRAAEQFGGSFDPEALQFEHWFFHVPGEIYVEHGHHYDYYGSLRYILYPVVPGDEPTIALPMGNLSNRHIMNRMGYFNPFASDYILNVFRYFTHWLRYYAFTRRSLFTPWLFGSFAVVFALLRQKSKIAAHKPPYREVLDRQAEQSGIDRRTLGALNKLRRPPIVNRFYRVIREFWIDRLILGLVMTGGTIALALSPIYLWIKLMVPLSSFPLLYLIYEWFAHGDSIFSYEQQALEYARKIGTLLSTPVVVFGHTHVPQLVPVAAGLRYVNTGTWAPVWDRNDPQGALVAGLRNSFRLTVDGQAITMDLDSYPGS